MEIKIKNAWDALHQIKFDYMHGKYPYHEAKKMCEPYLEIINAKGIEISKKYKMRPALLTFTKLMR